VVDRLGQGAAAGADVIEQQGRAARDRRGVVERQAHLAVA
jgi:hypothetical protein